MRDWESENLDDFFEYTLKSIEKQACFYAAR